MSETPRPPPSRRWLWLALALLLAIWPACVVREQYLTRRAIAELEAADCSVEFRSDWLPDQWRAWCFQRGSPLRSLVEGVDSCSEWICRRVGWETLFVQVTSVTISSTEIDYAWLLRLPKRHLKEVRIDGSSLQGSQLRCLAECKNLESLEIYDLPLQANDLDFFRDIPKLKDLHLTYCQLTDDALRDIAECHCTRLKLCGNAITDVGLKSLQYLPQLSDLSLANNQITDEGLKAVSTLTALQNLDLSNTKVTNSGMQHLWGLKDLHVLDLASTGVTDEGLQSLSGLVLLHLDMS